MRVSVFKDDPGYVSDAWRFEVYLDGERLDECFTADDESGEAWVQRVIDDNGSTGPVRLTGKVWIKKT